MNPARRKNKFLWSLTFTVSLGLLATSYITAIVSGRVFWVHESQADFSRLAYVLRTPIIKTLHKGNINGTPFLIPDCYLEYPVEYLDTSIWSSEKPKVPYSDRTFADDMQDFTIKVALPEFKPCANDDDNRAGTGAYDSKESRQLSITVDHGYADSPSPPQTPDNGLARMLRGMLQRLSDDAPRWRRATVYDPHTRKFQVLKGVHYDMHGVDPKTGLQSAIPVGPGAGTVDYWNQSLYWIGDQNHIVKTLIACDHGTQSIRPSFHVTRRCQQYYDLHDVKAEITLYYVASWLPQWNRLQEQSTKLVHSLKCPKECALNHNITKPQG